MASNDSGVDTSNDSNDGGAPVSPRGSDYGMKEFLVPCLPGLPVESASCSRKIRCRLNRRNCVRFKNCLPGIATLNEKKLRTAASTNNIELLTQLLNQGVNPNCCDHLQRSPLHLSACRGYTEIVKVLLQHGANPNVRDMLENTPLHLAACTNNVHMVTLLLSGTDIRSQDRNGRNPLQVAESKLKLIKLRKLADAAEMIEIRGEVQMIVKMMLSYLNLKKESTNELEEVNTRLAGLSTTEEVDKEVTSLLANLEDLAINN